MIKFPLRIYLYYPILWIGLAQTILFSTFLASCNGDENSFMQIELGVETAKEMNIHPKVYSDYIIRLSLVDGNNNSIYEPNFTIEGTLMVYDKFENILYSTKIPRDYVYTYNSLPLVKINANTELASKVDTVKVEFVEVTPAVNSKESHAKLIVRFQRHYGYID